MIVLLTEYYSGDKIKKNQMGGACGMCGEQERCIQGFGGETLGEGPIGRPRHRGEDNIKTCLNELGWEGMDCIDLTQNLVRRRAVVDIIIYFWAP